MYNAPFAEVSVAAFGEHCTARAQLDTSRELRPRRAVLRDAHVVRRYAHHRTLPRRRRCRAPIREHLAARRLPVQHLCIDATQYTRTNSQIALI